ncbi:MAG: NUDIX domain-containing protein [Bacteroidia bacterium]|nr:NUDIX domain-containing protein [Bacteroidia bacterium]
MIVGCLPVYEDRILLCRRAIEPRTGYWNLPAGYLENGETAEAGALRETLEEAGAEVELLRLHCLYNISRINQIYLFFLARLHAPVFHPGEETLEARLVRFDEIPYDALAFHSSDFAIRSYLAHLHTGYEGVHVGGS